MPALPWLISFAINSAVHLVGHYCRQEDFDQEPFSDSDDENPYGDSDDEEIDSDFEGDYDMEEGISGMLGEDDDEEDSEAEERFVELAAAIPYASSLALSPSFHLMRSD
jgi:hypothetical protein